MTYLWSSATPVIPGTWTDEAGLKSTTERELLTWVHKILESDFGPTKSHTEESFLALKFELFRYLPRFKYTRAETTWPMTGIDRVRELIKIW